MVETFRLLEAHSMKLASQNYFGGSESHASPYRAVLINRFDVAFTDRLGPADRADLDKTGYPTDAAHYALWSAKRPSFVMNCVEINQCVGCTRQFFTKSFLGDDSRAGSVER